MYLLHEILILDEIDKEATNVVCDDKGLELPASLPILTTACLLSRIPFSALAFREERSQSILVLPQPRLLPAGTGTSLEILLRHPPQHVAPDEQSKLRASP
jgi:hypothetical protein